MPQPNNDPFIKSKDFPYPIRKNANGGFDIILRPALTQGAITDAPAPVASDQLPPPMADEESFVGNMPRPRPENGPPMPQAPAADAAAEGGGGVGDMMDDIFTGRGGESTTGTHDGMPPDMGGILPGGWKESLASMVGGMQHIDRNQSPLAALASGMGGAMTTRENRRKDKREEWISDQDRQIAADERAYRHGRDTVGDTREARRDKWLEDANTRAGNAADMNEVTSYYETKLRQAQIEKEQVETRRLADAAGLTSEQRVAFEKTANDLFEKMWGKDTVVDEEDEDHTSAKFQETWSKARQLAYPQVAGAGGSAAPPGATGAPSGKAAGSSIDNPVQWSPATAPKSQADLSAQLDAAVAANGGQPVIFINPDTGKPRLYRGGTTTAAPP